MEWSMRGTCSGIESWVCRVVKAFACVLLLAAMTSTARAQPCGRWIDGPERGVAGVVGIVFDMLVCDPDGEGPMGTMLVLAGDFQIAGDTSTALVAGWDGTRWIAMGGGLRYGIAYSLTLHDGRLFVGGWFSGGPVSNVAWWDGTRWQSALPGPNGPVRALCSYRGELVAGGDFSGVFPNIRATGLTAWNGNSWRALGAGLDGSVSDLAVLGDRLIVGGAFDTAGGVASAGVAAWDGASWSALGAGGVFPSANGGRVVRALEVIGNDLFIGGEFGGVGGVAASGLARWNGTAWSAMTGNDRNVVGLAQLAGQLIVSEAATTSLVEGGTWRELAPIGNVYRGIEFRGEAHIAGNFQRGTGAWRWGVARQVAGEWQGISPGIDNPVLAILEYQGRVVAGGEFSHMGGVVANHVAVWNGTRWSAIGEGFDGTVRALTMFRGQLVAAGDFSTSGGVPCDRVATWDGSEWRGTVNVSLSGSVVAIAEYHGLLVLGVQFPAVGTDPAYFSVYLSDGTALTPIALENTGVLTRFFEHEGRLLVGGNFASIGGFASRNLAAWDGEGWGSVDFWQRGPVLCMARFNGELVVGASYRDGVWRLSSQSRIWSAVGRGLSSGATALVEYHGRLLAIGGFHLAEGQIADGLATWDGARWTPIGLGLGRQRGFSSANGALVYQDEVFTAGAFDHVDDVVSVNWARWKECPADVDDGSGTGACDGGVSIEDLFYYLDLFGAGSVRADIATREGELGADGEVTAEDLAVYLRRFAGGC